MTNDEKQRANFLTQLERIKNEDPVLYYSIETELLKLYKYRALCGARIELLTTKNKQVRTLEELTLEELIELEKQDVIAKYCIYKLAFPILDHSSSKPLYSLLTPIFLTYLMSAQSDEELFNLLQQANQENFRINAKWRAQLEALIEKQQNK